MTEASVVIQEGPGAGSEHPVDGELTLGREEGSADLVIDDPGVSRCHARVVADGGGVVVEDLGSSNGTFVNGERISGAVEVAAGDEIQVGGTVFGVEGADAATAMMPPGAPPTEHHPGPAQARPARSQPAPSRGPVPSRLAPHPHEGTNMPALAAVFLGPLSLLLLLLSAGAAFPIALPCGIAAIVLGTIGIRNVDRGKASGNRGLARIGRITGILGTILSTLALVVYLIVVAVIGPTGRSINDLVNTIKDDINGVKVPDVNAPSGSNLSSPQSGGGGDTGGVAPSSGGN
jgi:FHA domain-containing protein